MKPSIGRIVTIRGVESNGVTDHPAIITRAWGSGDTRNGPIAVNVTVLPDQGTPQMFSIIMLYDSAEVAPYPPGFVGYPVAFWPDRV